MTGVFSQLSSTLFLALSGLYATISRRVIEAALTTNVNDSCMTSMLGYWINVLFFSFIFCFTIIRIDLRQRLAILEFNVASFDNE